MVAGAISIEPESATELLLSVESNFGFHDVSCFVVSYQNEYENKSISDPNLKFKFLMDSTTSAILSISKPLLAPAAYIDCKWKPE